MLFLPDTTYRSTEKTEQITEKCFTSKSQDAVVIALPELTCRPSINIKFG